VVDEVFGSKDESTIENYSNNGFWWVKKTLPLSEIKLGNFGQRSEEENNKYTESLKKEGQKVPGIVDSNGILNDGYHRYFSLKNAGINIMTVYAPITPQQKQQAQQLYSQYVEQTGKQDIEGFKQFVSTQPTAPVSTGFQGYKGGFENVGKGTPQGDGKDKAMRQIADGFIGEVLDRNKQTSSNFSAKSIYEKDKTNNTLDYFDNAPTVVAYRETGVDGNKVVMLARNGELKNKPLSSETKNQIEIAFNNGGEFVVGDMPGVDSQFIDYLQEIGAKFTIYHTGSIPRIELDNTGNLTNFTERKDTEEDDSDDLDNNCTNPFLGE
jgi:hypothetical protein